jgi:hypothetical protein
MDVIWPILRLPEIAPPGIGLPAGYYVLLRADGITARLRAVADEEGEAQVYYLAEAERLARGGETLNILTKYLRYFEETGLNVRG